MERDVLDGRTPAAPGALTNGTARPMSPLVVTTWLKGFLIAALFILLDPFGCSEGASRVSERAIVGAVAPLVDRHEARPGRTRITVVLVDDAFMRYYRRESGIADATWPIARAEQDGYLLAPILQKIPSAVFVDWVFNAPAVGPRDDVADIEQSLRPLFCLDARLARTRLVLADRPPAAPWDGRRGCPFRYTTPEQLWAGSQTEPALRTLFVPEPAGNSCAGGPSSPDAHWAERAAIRHWGRPDRYPLAPLALRSPAPAPDRSLQPGDACPVFPATAAHVASPALALFSHWCASGDAAARNHGLCNPRAGQPVIAHDGNPTGYQLHRWSSATPDRLLTASVPQWLWFQSALMRQLRAEVGQGDHPCMALDGRTLWSSVFSAMRLRVGRPEETVPYNECFAIDTISAADLHSLSDFDDEPPGRESAMHRLFHNRLVLIGTNLESAPDQVYSPVNGMVPGVLLHATVLENLISDGPRRSREAPKIASSLSFSTALALLLAAFAAVPLGLVAQAVVQPGDGQDPALWRRAVVVGAAFAGLFVAPLLAVAIYRLTNWAPGDWASATTAKASAMAGALGALAYAFPATHRQVAGHIAAIDARIRDTLSFERRRHRLACCLLVMVAALFLILIIATLLD